MGFGGKRTQTLGLLANVHGGRAHLGAVPVVVPRVGVKGAQLHPAQAQLVLRVREEAADIRSCLESPRLPNGNFCS